MLMCEYNISLPIDIFNDTLFEIYCSDVIPDGQVRTAQNVWREVLVITVAVSIDHLNVNAIADTKELLVKFLSVKSDAMRQGYV